MNTSTLGTQIWIVLSADYAIKDLIDKRGAIYASRPDVYIPQQIFSGGKRPLFFVRTNARHSTYSNYFLNETL